MTKKTPVKNSNVVARLNQIAHLYQNPPKFQVGDIVILNSLFVTKEEIAAALKDGVSPLIVVLETVDSIRSVIPPAGRSVAVDYDGPGFLGADCRDGHTGLDMNWFAAWLYVKAPPEYTDDEPAATSH